AAPAPPNRAGRAGQVAAPIIPVSLPTRRRVLRLGAARAGGRSDPSRDHCRKGLRLPAFAVFARPLRLAAPVRAATAPRLPAGGGRPGRSARLAAPTGWAPRRFVWPPQPPPPRRRAGRRRRPPNRPR